MKRLNGCSVAVVLLTMVGCKGSGSGGPATTSDFCMQYAEALCQVTVPCGASMSTCVTYQESQCTASATAATTGTKRMYVPGNAAACINAVSAAFGGAHPDISVQTMANIKLACGYVFQGTAVALKDPCTTQFDCAGTTNGSIICDKGFCATQASTAADQPCGNPGQVCVANYYCAANGGGVQVCTAAAANGALCSDTVPCAQNLRCLSGTCTMQVASGSMCGSDSDCASAAPYCAPYVHPNVCTLSLNFSTGSPSCNCFTAGDCGSTGVGGAGGSSGAAGSNGAGGISGAGGLGGSLGAGGISGAGGLGGLGAA